MGFIKNNTIGLRLIRSIFGIYFFITLALTACQLYYEYRNEQNQLFEELSNISGIVKDGLEQAVWNLDIEQIEAVLLGVQKLGIVTYAEVTDESEKILAVEGKNYDPNALEASPIKNDKTQKDARADSSSQNRIGNYYRHKIRLIKTKLDGEPRVIGYFTILSSQSQLINRVKYDFMLVIFYATLKTVALWFLFLFFSRRIVTDPLNAMSEATTNMYAEAATGERSDSDFNRKLYSVCKDELGDLAKNFLNMRALVLEKIKQIEFQNDTLDQRISERTLSLEKANDELRRLSLHDPLTGLPNRNLFHDRLTTMIESAKREGFNFVVGSIDLKKFKQINDEHGHQAGDAVLLEIAKRMGRTVRKSDTLARMGGDEFALIAKGVGPDAQEIIAFGEKIVGCAYAPIQYDHYGIFAGIDIGLCSYDSSVSSGDMILKNADIAMYDAKNNEKGVSVYTRKIDEKAERYAKISRDLDAAIRDGKLTAYFQPVIDCKHNKVQSVEVLARWNHPELGAVSPMEFVAIAERSSTIKQLTDWAIEEAVKFVKQLIPLGFNQTISINMSGRLLDDADLARTITHLCDKYALSPSILKLELTESIMMEDPHKIIENLRILKGLGTGLSIDDFGTGYSSFSYLVRFPVDELKVDRSFLAEIDNPESRVVIEAIVSLAHKLGLTVVAEGVETQEMLDFIRTCGCDLAQGYYFSRPLGGPEFLLWYEDWRPDNV